MKQTTKTWSISITETFLADPEERETTKKHVIVKLSDQTKGLSREAFDKLLDEVTSKFSEYRILSCPEGLFIEGM